MNQPTIFKTLDISGVRSAYLAEYLGCWNLLENIFDAGVANISATDLIAHLQQQQSKSERKSSSGDDSPTQYQYEMTRSGVAIIDVVGTLMKAESSFSSSTSTLMLRRTIRSAVADPDVKAIMLRIDSPGGTTSGTAEMGEDIATAAGKKPLMAFIDDLGCSAAYWVASQAGMISCNATAVVGSIGTYMTAMDTSAAAAQRGVKVHVVKSAEAKGAGVSGSEVTPKQLSEWQRMIDDSQAVFTAAVAKGRGISMDDAKKLADARVHVGAAAKTAGMVDHVESFDAAMARLESMTPSGPIQRPGRKAKPATGAATNAAGGAAEGAASDAPERNEGATASREEGDQKQNNSTAEDVAAGSGASAPDAVAGAEAENSRKEAEMSSQSTEGSAGGASESQSKGPQPAKIEELEAAFPADPKFAIASYKKGLTLVEAKAEFGDVLQKQNEELVASNKKLADEKAEAEKNTSTRRGGAEALTRMRKERESGEQKSEQTGGDALADLKAIIDSKAAKFEKSGMDAQKARAKAYTEAVAQNPELKDEAIEEGNSRMARKRELQAQASRL